MKFSQFTKSSLAFRRQEKRLISLGYRRHETDWEINRGLGRHDEVIVDAIISSDGKYVYTKIGKENRSPE